MRALPRRRRGVGRRRGAAGVLNPQVGDGLRVWLLSRRSEDSDYAVLAGTLMAEGAGELAAGLAVLAVALTVGLAPAFALTWHFSPPASRQRRSRWDRRRSSSGAGRLGGASWRVSATGWHRWAPPAPTPSVTPWQLTSRACRYASMGCFLAAFHLPVTPLTVPVVLFAQTTGRLVPFAPVALGAGVAVLAATFEAAAGSTGRSCPPRRLPGRHDRRAHPDRSDPRRGAGRVVRHGSAAGDVAQERRERHGQRGHGVGGRHPRGAPDRRPVDRLAQQALPRVELRREQVRAAGSRARRSTPSSCRISENISVPDDRRGASCA